MSNDPRLRVDPTALFLVVLLFAEHLLYGGDRLDFGLAFAVIELLFLAVVLMGRGAAPPPLPLAPALLLGAVYAIALFSTLPVGAPLAHPLWAYVQTLQPGVVGTVSLDPTATRVQLVKLSGYAAVFLIGAGLGGRRDSADQTFRYLTIAGLIYGLLTIGAFAINPRGTLGGVNAYGAGRMTASFVSANTAATLFASLAVIGLAGVLRPLLRARRLIDIDREAFGRQWPAMALALLALAGLLLTASRGGLLALAAAVVGMIGLAVRIKSARNSLTGGFLGAVFGVLTIGLILFAVGGQTVTQRLSDTSLQHTDRAQFLAAYWPTIKASPWLGYGLGAFSSFNAASMTSDNAVTLADQGAAHSVYLQWLLQVGWPGTLAMFGAVGLVLAATVHGVIRRAGQQAIGLACLGTALVFAVHGLTDFAFEIPSMAAFFSALLGLGYGLAERPASPRRR